MVTEMIEAVYIRVDGQLVLVKIDELPDGVFRASVGEGLDVFSSAEHTGLATAVLQAVTPDSLPFQELFSRLKYRARKLNSGVMSPADYRFFDALMLKEEKQKQSEELVKAGAYFEEE